MSILATMFVKLCNSECFISISKRFFCCFCSIVKMQKRKSEFFFNLNENHKFCLQNFEIVAILLVNSGKSRKFCSFESILNLVFFRFESCSFLFVLNFFLNFEQKLARVLLKLLSQKKEFIAYAINETCFLVMAK